MPKALPRKLLIFNGLSFYLYAIWDKEKLQSAYKSIGYASSKKQVGLKGGSKMRRDGAQEGHPAGREDAEA